MAPGEAPRAIPEPPRHHLRTALLVAASVVGVALSARVSVPVPGSPVPQSLQTLAVVLLGAALGLRLAVAALVTYLLAGAVGLPVFADGAAGAAHLVGPTAGYLFGFVAAAALVGLARDVGRLDAFGTTFVVAAAAHGVILAAGWTGLAVRVGPGTAFASGVEPFLWGAVVKSAAAAAVVGAARPARGAAANASPP